MLVTDSSDAVSVAKLSTLSTLLPNALISDIVYRSTASRLEVISFAVFVYAGIKNKFTIKLETGAIGALGSSLGIPDITTILPETSIVSASILGT